MTTKNECAACGNPAERLAGVFDVARQLTAEAIEGQWVDTEPGKYHRRTPHQMLDDAAAELAEAQSKEEEVAGG